MNPTILRLSIRAVFGQKRIILVLVPPVLLLAFSIFATVISSFSDDLIGPASVVFGLGIVVPLVSLLLSMGVLGPEIEDGSIVYLLATPTSRYTIALSKYVIATVGSVLLGAVPVFFSVLILDIEAWGQAFALFIGSALACMAYCGLFLALTSLVKFSTVAGLVYVLIIEGLFSGWLTGIAYLSVGRIGGAIARSMSDDLPSSLVTVNTTYAWIAVFLTAILGVLITGQRLSSFQLKGEVE